MNTPSSIARIFKSAQRQPNPRESNPGGLVSLVVLGLAAVGGYVVYRAIRSDDMPTPGKPKPQIPIPTPTPLTPTTVPKVMLQIERCLGIDNKASACFVDDGEAVLSVDSQSAEIRAPSLPIDVVVSLTDFFEPNDQTEVAPANELVTPQGKSLDFVFRIHEYVDVELGQYDLDAPSATVVATFSGAQAAHFIPMKIYVVPG